MKLPPVLYERRLFWHGFRLTLFQCVSIVLRIEKILSAGKVPRFFYEVPPTGVLAGLRCFRLERCAGVRGLDRVESWAECTSYHGAVFSPQLESWAECTSYHGAVFSPQLESWRSARLTVAPFLHPNWKVGVTYPGPVFSPQLESWGYSQLSFRSWSSSRLFTTTSLPSSVIFTVMGNTISGRPCTPGLLWCQVRTA